MSKASWCLFSVIWVVLIAIVITTVSCAKPSPQLPMVQAKIQQAKDEGKYDSTLQKLDEELNADLELQRSRFFKSYVHHYELCKAIIDYEPQSIIKSIPEAYGTSTNRLQYCPCCGKKL
jgi:hypothetical protein